MRRVPQPHHGQRPRGLRADGTDHLPPRPRHGQRAHPGRGLRSIDTVGLTTQAGRLCSPRCPSSRTSSQTGRAERGAATTKKGNHHARDTHVRRRRRPSRGRHRSGIEQPTDALVRITASCICGSDLHPYSSMRPPAMAPLEWATSSSAWSRTPEPRCRPSRRATSSSRHSRVRQHLQFCREGLQTACATRRLLDNIPRRGRSGRGDPSSPGRWHAGQAAGREPTPRSCPRC